MKKVDFSETIAACDLKLIKLIKICEYWTLAQGHLYMKIKLAFPIATWPFFSQILNESL